MIRLAMLGTGTIAQSHAGAAQEIADCEIAAVVNHRPESMAQLQHFLDCIESDSKPSPGAREGCEIMRIVDAAYESSHRGQVMFLGDEP